MLDLDISGIESLEQLQHMKKREAAKDFLIVKPVNQWMEEASRRPDPKKLCGSLWYEGEVCVLFASNNTGKSAFAVQIGEAIASGKPLTLPLEMESTGKRVLFLDCELSDKQFQLRYIDENGRLYPFSENFYRAELSRAKLLKGQTIDELILSSVEWYIREYEIEVVILDNLCALQIDMEKSTEAVALMTGLQQFQKEHKVSIMVVGHSPKRQFNQPITDNDLSGSKVLMNLADSAFCIGNSQQDRSFRYLKQIKVRNSEKLYGTDNVLLCEMRLVEGFLGFHFLNYDDEYQHLQQKSSGKSEEEELSLVRQLLKDGKTQREIRDHMEMALGKVNRLCRIVREEKR